MYPLPGRDWHTYIGPAEHPHRARLDRASRSSPPDRRPDGHVHDTQEETIYCVAGRGRIVTPDGVGELEPGVIVWVSPGTPHATESDGPEPLELGVLLLARRWCRAHTRRASPDGHRACARRRQRARGDRALEDMARRIRVAVIRTVTERKVGHVGGPLSSADILAALYGRFLRVRPDEPDWPDRDRFILSKGHSALVQYAAMALAGYFDLDEMFTFNQKGSRLQGHPDMNKLPGIDISTGSLGMGLSRRPGHGPRAPGIWARTCARTCCSATASARRGRSGRLPMWRPGTRSTISSPSWITTSSSSSAGAVTRPATGSPPEDPGALVARFKAFGWRVLEMNGNDMPDVVRVLDEARRADGPAHRHHRQHAQGLRRSLHGRQLQVAHGRADRRRVRHRHGRARRDRGGCGMTLPMASSCAWSSVRRSPSWPPRTIASSCSTGTSAARPRPRSSRTPTPTASSRWVSPSRTCSASPRAWPRWGWCRSSAPSSPSRCTGRSTRSACSSPRPAPTSRSPLATPASSPARPARPTRSSMTSPSPGPCPAWSSSPLPTRSRPRQVLAWAVGL